MTNTITFAAIRRFTHGVRNENMPASIWSSVCHCRAPKRAARHRSGKLSAVDRQRAIHENVTHPHGKKCRLAISRAVGDGRRVEDDDISKVTDCEGAALGEAERGG